MAKSTRRRRRAQPNVVLYPAPFQRAWRMRPRPRPLADRPGPPRDARLAPGARGERGPHGPPLRLLASDGVPLAGPLRPVTPRDPRGPQLPADPPPPADLDARPARPPSARSASATRAGARTSWSSCCAARASVCRPRWSAGSCAASGAAGELREPVRRRISGVSGAGGVPTPCASPRTTRSPGPATWSRSTRSTCDRCRASCFKQFTARDVVSRWDVLELLHRRRHARGARSSTRSPTRMPFPVRAICGRRRLRVHGRVRGGLPARGLPLFVLPPRSPKLNGAVERANRTHTEEFYE